MATKLGPVDIVVKLDTSEAERQIQRLAAKANAATGDAARGEGVSPTVRAAKLGPVLGPPSPAKTVDVDEMEERRERVLRRIRRKSIRGDEDEDGWLDSVGEDIGRGRGGRGRLLRGPFNAAARFLPSGARAYVRGAGAFVSRASAVYGIASGTAKLLPTALAFGEQMAEGGAVTQTGAADPLVGDLRQAFDSLRRSFVNLESYVKSVVPALKKQVAISEASLRLTGQLPNTEYYRKMYLDMERQDIRLKDKFDTWKAREAPFVTIQTLYDTFKRQLTGR